LSGLRPAKWGLPTRYHVGGLRSRGRQLNGVVRLLSGGQGIAFWLFSSDIGSAVDLRPPVSRALLLECGALLLLQAAVQGARYHGMALPTTNRALAAGPPLRSSDLHRASGSGFAADTPVALRVAPIDLQELRPHPSALRAAALGTRSVAFLASRPTVNRPLRHRGHKQPTSRPDACSRSDDQLAINAVPTTLAIRSAHSQPWSIGSPGEAGPTTPTISGRIPNQP
jgi:hypothetical protein